VRVTRAPISIVVPVLNAGPILVPCLEAILADVGDRPCEVLIVDDGSTDGSFEEAERFASDRRIRLIRGRRLGAAAALNDGIRAARHPIVCQIDQDVVVHSGWFACLLEPFADPAIGAVQGRYSDSVGRSLLARVAALDLTDRYERVGERTNHVCTGNVAYRTQALHAVGLFDERLGYGYDNDLSYRLAAAGYSLAFRRQATASHGWRNSLGGYLRQQYGVGYGRLDVVARHRARWSGDDVSGILMIAHAGIAFATLALGTLAMLLGTVGVSPRIFVAGPIAAIGVLMAERAWAAVRLWLRHRDPAAWLLPLAHAARDAAWAWAILVWSIRRLRHSSGVPDHSMSRRAPATRPDGALLRHVMAVLPAYNERAALPVVVGELGERWPDLRVLVVDDGSDDGTFERSAWGSTTRPRS
jgi:glycosyltransferase involved in cell wall biosynthesis